MKFEPRKPRDAVGGIAAHTVRAGGIVVKKGAPVTAEQAETLARAGIETIIVADAEPGDVGEDVAAAAFAAAVAGENVRVDRAFTGRANLFAETAGVLVVDKDAIDRLNGVDEAITFATLEAYRAVVAGEMIATVKIIPYAVPEAVFRAALGTVGAPMITVAPYRRKRVALISTLLPGLHEKIVDKTVAVTAARLKPAEAVITVERRVAHSAEAVAAAIAEVRDAADLILVFGASAIADRRDVIPAGVTAAGGSLVHLGMPVDPGNLMLVARLGETPVLGAPGCARSPKENGFDWVLARLLADLPVTAREITGMGVGGLLMEIISRPQPRAGAPEEASDAAPDITAILLAAGRSSRMGGPNKLLETVDGKPMVRHAAEAALASRARRLIVVTGHQAEAVRAALAGLDAAFVDNPHFADGLSTSLKAGLAAVPASSAGAVILLGDMPAIGAAHVDAVIGAFAPEKGQLVVVPRVAGQRGNPVLWARRFFPELAAVEGDRGARDVIARYPDAVTHVDFPDAATLVDLDTPESLAAFRGRRESAK